MDRFVKKEELLRPSADNKLVISTIGSEFVVLNAHTPFAEDCVDIPPIPFPLVANSVPVYTT